MNTNVNLDQDWSESKLPGPSPALLQSWLFHRIVYARDMSEGLANQHYYAHMFNFSGWALANNNNNKTKKKQNENKNKKNGIMHKFTLVF